MRAPSYFGRDSPAVCSAQLHCRHLDRLTDRHLDLGRLGTAIDRHHGTAQQIADERVVKQHRGVLQVASWRT
jgi:hypothetical protein